MKIIDDFLNNITMYRLMLYFLLLIFVWALFLSFIGTLPFQPLALIFSASLIMSVCWVANRIFSFIFKAPTNLESVYITALILSLIITPTADIRSLSFLFFASVLATASKFILSLNKKHIFNPAAVGVLITYLTLGGAVSWWVGTAYIMPVVLIGGLLIVKKLDQWDSFFCFLAVAVPLIFIPAYLNGNDLTSLIRQIFLESPILFFALIMLTEPLTSPPGRLYRILYGGLVGFLFTPLLHVGTFYTTPEMALVLGNIFAFIVSPKDRLVLKLQQKNRLAPDIYDFIFEQSEKRVSLSASARAPLIFKPGQYLEWTLGYKDPDSRGTRRYFTIASSPTEDNLRIGVRLNDPSSSYKKALLNLNPGDEIVAGSLGGEFVLPEDKSKKLVFVAGGIGVTPYRSIVKNLIDKNETRDIILLYSVRNVSDAVYMDVFKQAENLGVKTIITLTDAENIPDNWSGEKGIITKEMIEKEVPDYRERIFYLSGAHGMVTSFEKTLSEMGLPKSQVKIDYFTGY
ncbi:MAG: oxidoreductase [Candidatus Daviesbacteria bacterium]|nr:oxidoreductase [Candidatus Daviesbacteria bacterium]